MISIAKDAAGWSFASDGLPSGTVYGASLDEGGNLTAMPPRDHQRTAPTRAFRQPSSGCAPI